MKQLAFLFPLLLVSGVAAAEGKAPLHPAAGKTAAIRTHEVSVVVVSADLKSGKLVYRMGAEEKTAPVEGKALASLKSVKPGQHVTLTCRDDDAGEHQAITAIQPSGTLVK